MESKTELSIMIHSIAYTIFKIVHPISAPASALAFAFAFAFTNHNLKLNGFSVV